VKGARIYIQRKLEKYKPYEPPEGITFPY